MSFPPGTEMFQFPGFASRNLCIQLQDTQNPAYRWTPALAGAGINGMSGFPHSEICGSKVAHTSPQLIAACHVLHRLCMPRHPPNALTSRLRVHTTNDRAECLVAAMRFICLSIVIVDDGARLNTTRRR